jgi:hypothetical protein
MHGLILVTWEHDLGGRFGNGALHAYREKVHATPSAVVLPSESYDDEAFLAGAAASELTYMPVETLLREFWQLSCWMG